MVSDPSLQVLVFSILVVTGMMCVAKRYIDTAVMPYITHQGGHKTTKPKAKEGQKKQSTWEILRYCLTAAALVYATKGRYTVQH